jgi:hypothetical protein
MVVNQNVSRKTAQVSHIRADEPMGIREHYG